MDLLIDAQHKKKVEALTSAAKIARALEEVKAREAASRDAFSACVTVVDTCAQQHFDAQCAWELHVREREHCLVREDKRGVRQATKLVNAAKRARKESRAALKVAEAGASRAQRDLDRAKAAVAEWERRHLANVRLQQSLGLMERGAKRARPSSAEVDEVSTYLLNGEW